MNQLRTAAVLLAITLLTGCAEEVQFHEHIGSIETAAVAVSPSVSFVDRGRWPLFQLIDNQPTGTWPLPFRVDLLDANGREILSKRIDQSTSASEMSGKGFRLLSWGLDELHGSFESNLDRNGDLPIDHLLQKGQRYTLRFTLPPAPAHRYEVVLLASRKLYPWQL